MKKFILGTKERMTQIFDEKGNAIPATLIKAGPVTVSQIKTKEKDGYEALQFGFMKIHSNSKRKSDKFRYFKELKDDNILESELKEGDSIDVSFFLEGDIVEISGISKGKGFQGVVKRHGFKGGPRTHGQKHSEREPGSIGIGGIQRVFKGTRMAGRTGGDRTTIKNLYVLKIDKDKNELLVSGALPGRKGTLLEIRSIKK